MVHFFRGNLDPEWPIGKKGNAGGTLRTHEARWLTIRSCGPAQREVLESLVLSFHGCLRRQVPSGHATVDGDTSTKGIVRARISESSSREE